MKKKLFMLATILGCAVIQALFSSCVKDALEFKPEVTLPRDAEFEDGALLVPQPAGEFTLDIATSGEWRIESDRRFLRPAPAEGKGNATVTVSVQANQSDERKLGHLTIVFPGHEDQNKTITVEQAWYGDPVPNGADPISTSNKIYAVGFSYDCTGEYASPNSVKMEVFDTQALMNDKILAVSAPQTLLTSTIITGSSISELTDKLAVKANVSGGFGKFKAEAGASYDTSNSKNASYEYASSYFDYVILHASLSRSLEALKDTYMTDDAYNDINGVPVTNARGITKVHYPSPTENNTEGFRSLVEQYGTHVIVEAGLGGRLRHTMSVDISKISKSYDVKAFAKASYQGVIDVGGSVNESFSKSFEENKDCISIKVETVGGDANLAKTLCTQSGFTSENVKDWKYSVTGENMALVSFGDKSLVPLYELVERGATLENGGFDGQKRYEALKDYIDSGCSGDFSFYECGTVTKFSVPSFADKQNGGTLIQDVWLGGQWVGQVCEEFVPLIDMKKRVTVVYPVLNNRPRYNMGFFIGDEDHKPARVSWVGGNCQIVEYSELDFGVTDALYLRGASVAPNAAEGTDVKQGSLKDEYLEGFGYDGSKNAPCNYPLVKISNQVWTRSCYKYYSRSSDGILFVKTATFNGELYAYYSIGDVQVDRPAIYGYKVQFPSGWRIGKEEDYKDMIKSLEDSKVPSPGTALLQGGQTGFDVVFAGKFWMDNWEGSTAGMHYALWANNEQKQTRRVKFLSDGTVFFEDFNGGDFHCIRLIKQ